MDGIRVCTLVIVICVACSLCHPSRPLNERSPELAWQAWLLVDDQYQGGRQNGGGGGGAGEPTLKRRITPKSVFIAPTFSPQDLPPCAEGYASDPMGRCMKIFKLDEDEHLNFLLDKLKEKFGGADLDYGDEEEQDNDKDTPLQINIPFGSDELHTSNSDDETDMAIVVAPTNSNFTVQEFPVRSADVDEKDVVSSASDEISVRISTATVSSLENLETTTFFTTSTSPVTELSTIPYSTTTISTSSTDDSESDDDSTTTEIYSSTTIVPSTTEQISTETNSEDSTTFSFASQTETTTEIVTETSTTEPSTTTEKRKTVRFPDDVGMPENDLIGSQQTRDTSNRVRNFWPNFSNGPATSQQLVRFPDSRKISFPHADRWAGYGGAANIQKPLVLRFSKKNSYVDANQFTRPDFYRALPSNDLSYIFGFKHRPPQKN